MSFADLPVDPIPLVATLSDEYPHTWVYAHDLNFSAPTDGKVIILDVAASTHNYKGAIGAGLFASFTFAKSRPELYVAETFYTRRTRGERIDTITIYDRKTLTPTGEIILPGGKRLQVVTQENALHLIDNERLALVSNFTPAASVTIVDLIEKKILGEVQTPACSLTYPTGQRGFSTLCGNGAMSTFILNEDGSVKSNSMSKPFNDIDNDALFSQTAVVDGITYFPSFTGRIRPVDLRGDEPRILDDWSLVSEGLAKEGWRPGGLQLIGGHPNGSLYVLMHPEGKEGTHKSGGSEVWVFDPESKQRLARLTLTTWGVSIAVTQSDPAYLVVTNTNMDLDVYTADKGEFVRTIGDNVADAPLLVHAHR